MSRPEMNVAVVCGPDCDMETQAVRASLEYFGARVFTYWVGRPHDLISVLTGEDLYPDTDIILLNFHGDEGKLIMPELDESIYEDGEPHGDFGPGEIKRFTMLHGKTVIASGCTLGDPATAKAFMDSGCRAYIGPDDYPDGSMALMFVIRFFYEMIHHKKDIKEAFHLARAVDEDMSMYRLYQ